MTRPVSSPTYSANTFVASSNDHASRRHPYHPGLLSVPTYGRAAHAGTHPRALAPRRRPPRPGGEPHHIEVTLSSKSAGDGRDVLAVLASDARGVKALLVDGYPRLSGSDEVGLEEGWLAYPEASITPSVSLSSNVAVVFLAASHVVPGEGHFHSLEPLPHKGKPSCQLGWTSHVTERVRGKRRSPTEQPPYPTDHVSALPAL